MTMTPDEKDQLTGALAYLAVLFRHTMSPLELDGYVAELCDLPLERVLTAITAARRGKFFPRIHDLRTVYGRTIPDPAETRAFLEAHDRAGWPPDPEDAEREWARKRAQFIQDAAARHRMQEEAEARRRSLRDPDAPDPEPARLTRRHGEVYWKPDGTLMTEIELFDWLDHSGLGLSAQIAITIPYYKALRRQREHRWWDERQALRTAAALIGKPIP
jgi:hypothetical protein